MAAYRAALQERTRDKVPLNWAATQNNLGTALSTLGARESGTAPLEQAVVAYRAALEEQTRDRVPLVWAMTQNNLGAALALWGERDGNLERLQAAVAAGRAALEERTRDRVPLDWALSCGNLAFAETLLAVQQTNLIDAQAALRRLEDAHGMLSDERHAAYAQHLVPRIEKARAAVATLAGGGAAGQGTSI